MCGILGLWQANQKPIDLTALQRATDSVRHRGPDDEGYLLVNSRCQQIVPCAGPITSRELGLPPLSAFQEEPFDLAFGFRRLAILDLSVAGHQPMCSNDGKLWLVFNGEIYNYLELQQELAAHGHTFRSHADTEVILHAYQAWGEACVERFNGMWAFAIYDSTRNVLFCSRDRLGIKPFYYFWDGAHFAFASEAKALLRFPFVANAVNRRAVYEYLAHGAVEYGEETFFSGIHKLLHSHNLTLDLNRNQLQVKQYYELPVEINDRLSLVDAAAEFRRLLNDSVRLQLRSDVAVGSCLSGGLDSSSLVCLMANLLTGEGQADRQHTFSSHFEEEEANELVYMQEVIRATDVHPHFIYPTLQDFIQDLDQLIWHQEEPFGSTSIFAQWSVFKLVQAHGVKVVLDGQGPDEMMGGYLPLVKEFFKDLLRKQQMYRFLRESWLHNRRYGQPLTALAPLQWGPIQRSVFGATNQHPPSPTNDWLAPAMVNAHAAISQFQANRRLLPFGEREHFQNVLYQLTFLNNLPALLKYEDRNSMAFSVEARVPFLDHRLVEFIFSLPATLKVQEGYTKYVLREAMAGVLPEKIRWRTNKLGFATPEKAWQQTVLNNLAQEALHDPRLHAFVEPGKAMAYVETSAASAARSSVAWRLINLSRWMKMYDLHRICDA